MCQDLSSERGRVRLPSAMGGRSTAEVSVPTCEHQPRRAAWSHRSQSARSRNDGTYRDRYIRPLAAVASGRQQGAVRSAESGRTHSSEWMDPP